MNKRHSVRYDTQLFLKTLRKVTVSWGVDISIESEVANFSTHGMKVIIPHLVPQTDIPKKHDTIRFKLSIIPVWLTGKCIYATIEHDSSVAIGICYLIPIEQNDLNELLKKTNNGPFQTCSTDCHEWEDLVAKQFNSEDPKLKML
jgi:hypothetical protein